VRQLQLCRLEDDVGLAVVVADQRLVALVDPAVERQVDVGADEPRHDVVVGGVDHGGPGGHADGAARPGGADPALLDQADGVGDGGATGAVDERAAGDGDDAVLRGGARDDGAQRGQAHAGRGKTSGQGRVSYADTPAAVAGVVVAART
jgi:hypothetical protein